MKEYAIVNVMYKVTQGITALWSVKALYNMQSE